MKMMFMANPSMVRLVCSGHTVQWIEETRQKAFIVTVLVIVSGVLGSGFQEAALGAAKDKKREILKCLVQAGTLQDGEGGNGEIMNLEAIIVQLVHFRDKRVGPGFPKQRFPGNLTSSLKDYGALPGSHSPPKENYCRGATTKLLEDRSGEEAGDCSKGERIEV